MTRRWWCRASGVTLAGVSARPVVDSVFEVNGPPAELAALEQRLKLLREAHPGAIIERYLDRIPTLGARVYVAPGAALIGEVTLEGDVSIWFGCVLRADINSIVIKARSNIQDGSVIHLGDRDATVVEEEVVVGHRAVLHGCHVGAGTLVGIQATILDGATIGEGSIIAAGALVKARMVVPPRSLVMGVPGVVVRKVGPDDVALHRKLALKYVRLAHNYRLG